MLDEHAEAGGGVELLEDRALRGEERWTVLHVMSRQEKALVSELAGRGIASYLPLVRSVRYYGHRKQVVDIPLFPGYVFLWGTLDQAYEADRTRRVANLIPVERQEQLEQELQSIHHALSGDASLEPCSPIREGMRAEVRSGPFKGLQGVVESRARMDRLVLQVGMLGRAVSLEIEGSLLDSLE